MYVIYIYIYICFMYVCILLVLCCYSKWCWAVISGQPLRSNVALLLFLLLLLLFVLVRRITSLTSSMDKTAGVV